jgi:hypothetical protein
MIIAINMRNVVIIVEILNVNMMFPVSRKNAVTETLKALSNVTTVVATQTRRALLHTNQVVLIATRRA